MCLSILLHIVSSTQILHSFDALSLMPASCCRKEEKSRALLREKIRKCDFSVSIFSIPISLRLYDSKTNTALQWHIARLQSRNVSENIDSDSQLSEASFSKDKDLVSQLSAASFSKDTDLASQLSTASFSKETDSDPQISAASIQGYRWITTRAITTRASNHNGSNHNKSEESQREREIGDRLDNVWFKPSISGFGTMQKNEKWKMKNINIVMIEKKHQLIDFWRMCVRVWLSERTEAEGHSNRRTASADWFLTYVCPCRVRLRKSNFWILYEWCQTSESCQTPLLTAHHMH